MSSYFDKLLNNVVEKEVEKEKESIAMKFIKLGENTFEKIAECTGLTLAQVKHLAAQQTGA